MADMLNLSALMRCLLIEERQRAETSVHRRALALNCLERMAPFSQQRVLLYCASNGKLICLLNEPHNSILIKMSRRQCIANRPPTDAVYLIPALRVTQCDSGNKLCGHRNTPSPPPRRLAKYLRTSTHKTPAFLLSHFSVCLFVNAAPKHKFSIDQHFVRVNGTAVAAAAHRRPAWSKVCR